MDIEKNIIEIVNNVLQIIQETPYYSKSIDIKNIDLKDIDMLWDHFRFTNNIYKKYYPNHKLEIDLDNKKNDNLNNIIENNKLLKTIFSLHVLTDKSHIITFSYSDNENLFILYKNDNDKSNLPSNFISLTMPNPENSGLSENILKISCYFED